MAMIGAVLPDVIKLGIIFDFVGVDVWDYFQVLHLPVGSFILAGIISLLFEDKRTIFLFLSLGVASHFLLDVLLIHLTGGSNLLFPISWQIFNLDLVPTDDYYITILALMVALIVYLFGKWNDSRIK
jgi:hypothetical protein